MNYLETNVIMLLARYFLLAEKDILYMNTLMFHITITNGIEPIGEIRLLQKGIQLYEIYSIIYDSCDNLYLNSNSTNNICYYTTTVACFLRNSCNTNILKHGREEKWEKYNTHLTELFNSNWN